MEDQSTLIERSIMESLPQVPYVLDQVGAAMKWRKKETCKNSYEETLRTTLDLCKYVRTISEGNFYKAHLVTAFLLMGIDNCLNKEEFDFFRSASGAIEDSIRSITLDKDLVKEKGYYRALAIRVSELAVENEEYLALILFNILLGLRETSSGMSVANVKVPITFEDYTEVLGAALLIAYFRLSNKSLLFTTRDIINSIEILLNEKFNY